MILLPKKFFQVLSLFLSFLVTVDSIKCYRCSSTDALEYPYQCTEYFEDSEIEPQSCDDVFNAQYCVKQIGRFEAWNISCSDLLILDGPIQPESCDKIYDAQYCIKMTDGVGVKRFCSHADLGNYCHYIKQLGDVREYRTCYFTCTGDGCNSAVVVKPATFFLFLIFISLTFIFCLF